MKRFFNLRYTVLFSVAFALGAVACLAFYNRLVAPSVVFLSLPVVIGVVVGIVQKNNRFKVAVVSMVCLMLVLAGFLSFNWRVESSFPSNASGDAIVSARFTSKEFNGRNYTYSFDDATFTLENKVFKNQKLTVYSSANLPLEYGTTLSFSATLSSRKTWDENGRLNVYALNSGVMFSGSAPLADAVIVGKSLTVFERLRLPMERTIRKGMSEVNSEFVLSMMFGNTEGMNEHIINGMRYAGIAHVFAVSGLHVGFISAIITMLLRLLRVNRWINAAVSIAVTFIYCGICAFSPSSVRALIMFALYSVIRASGRKYDILGSMFTSMLALLLINPVNIADYGFILSYAAVIGVALYSKQTARFLCFLPEDVRDGAAVTISAQVGILPFSIAFFGYTSAISVLINVVMVPVISVFFVYAFASTVIASVTTLSGLMFLPNVLTGLFVKLVSGIDFSAFSISGEATIATVCIYAVGMVIASDAINLPFKVKVTAFTCACAISILFSQLFISGIL